MAGRILAICDADREYITALTKRIGKQKSAGLDIHGFTDRKALLGYAKEQLPDLILMNETLIDEEIQRKFQGRMLVLTEHRPQDERETASKQEIREQPMGIYKYQASSEVMKQVLEALSSPNSCIGVGKKNSVQTENGIQMVCVGHEIHKPRTEMIGVYSPVGRCGKTSFALALALSLQKTRPTLFLSFEIFSGWQYLYPQAKNAAGSLADGIYYLRNGNLRVAEKLLAKEQKMEELSFLPPFSDPQDLLHVTDEEWKVVLDSIRCETGFEAVVADLGVIPAFCPAVLLNFSKIFMPVAAGQTEQSKLRDFEAYLRKNLLDTEMKERTREIHLPVDSEEREFQANPLLYGKMEDFADDLICQEHL